MEIVKHSKNLGTLTFKEIPKEVAKPMIIENHYSHKWGTQFGYFNVGVFKEGRLLGCAVYGYMKNCKAYKKLADIEENEVCELNRMWIDDELGHNAETMLIGASLKLMKQLRPEIKIVQSFADGRLGCGTIYKASNFRYYGYHTSLFLENVETGEIKQETLFNNGSSFQACVDNNREWINGKYRVFRVKTYRYIYILDKRVHMNLKEQPYPQYEKGETPDVYKPSNNLCGRMILAYDAEGDVETRDKFIHHLKQVKGLTSDEVSDILRTQASDKNLKKWKERNGYA